MCGAAAEHHGGLEPASHGQIGAGAGATLQEAQPRRDTVPEGIPPSAGALIDRAGLKDHVIGGARVSPVHANFIVNDGTATATDIAALVDLCRATVAERFGVTLRDEIVRLGAWQARG